MDRFLRSLLAAVLLEHLPEAERSNFVRLRSLADSAERSPQAPIVQSSDTLFDKEPGIEGKGNDKIPQQPGHYIDEDQNPEPAGRTDDGEPHGDDGVATCNCQLVFVPPVEALSPFYSDAPAPGVRLGNEANSGGNVYAWVDTFATGHSRRSPSASAKSTGDYRIAHRNPCPECNSKAQFVVAAKTNLEATAYAWPKTCDPAYAEAELAVAAAGIINFKEIVAAIVKEKVPSGFTVNLSLPIGTGGSTSLTYTPDVYQAGTQKKEGAATDRQEAIGNFVTWKMAAEADADCYSEDDSNSGASAKAKTITTWAARCDCPRHTYPRTASGYVAGPNDVKEALSALDALAKDFLPTPPPPDVGASAKVPAKTACYVRIDLTGIVAQPSPPSSEDWEFKISINGNPTILKGRFHGGHFSFPSPLYLYGWQLACGASHNINLIEIIITNVTKNNSKYFHWPKKKTLQCPGNVSDPPSRLAWTPTATFEGVDFSFKIVSQTKCKTVGQN